MARTRRSAVALGLLACLPVTLFGATSAVTGQRAETDASTHGDELKVGRAHRVAISGTVRATLSPGVSAPVELTFVNSNPRTVRMRRVRVTIATVAAPHADATHPCTRADFSVRQMPKQTLRIRRGVSDLTRLRVPMDRWPYLTMLNRPVNQDGCKDARLTLRFRAHRVGR